MARPLRVQFPGALYHVINRGNYRRDVFETVGAAIAFETALGDACVRHDWRLHAYVIMRNHYHLALETPCIALVEGMHWLQSTFATRFNRMRSERGHLFQGRYQALLVEDAAALVRVIDYIHLNPVRAGIVPPAQVAAFRWSSLRRMVKRQCPEWLSASLPLLQLGLENNRAGWERYVHHLVAASGASADDRQRQESELTHGWAIGTPVWRQTLAQAHAHFAPPVGLATPELRAIKEVRWRHRLAAALQAHGKTSEDIARASQQDSWKIAVAAQLRREAAAPYGWIAQTLNLGGADALRSTLFRRSKQKTA